MFNPDAYTDSADSDHLHLYYRKCMLVVHSADMFQHMRNRSAWTVNKHVNKQLPSYSTCGCIYIVLSMDVEVRVATDLTHADVRAQPSMTVFAQPCKIYLVWFVCVHRHSTYALCAKLQYLSWPNGAIVCTISRHKLKNRQISLYSSMLQLYKWGYFLTSSHNLSSM